MQKAKVIPLDKRAKRSSQILSKYLSIAGLEAIREIRNHIFDQTNNLKQRKKYLKDSEIIFKNQRPIFKELIKEFNRSAQKDNFKNHIEFTLKNNGVNKKSFHLFLKNLNKVIRMLNTNIPLPKNLPQWHWSEYNIVDPLYLFSKKFTLKIPEDIYKKTLKINPEYKKYLKKIDIKLSKEDIFYPHAQYDKKSNRVTIELRYKEGNVYNINTFVHELGHAICFLKCEEKGKSHLGKSRFWNEKQAYKFTFEFQEKFFPKKLKDAARADVLGTFVKAIFEYGIYTNPEQDFDKLYAEAHNRCYPKSKQTKNPSYLLEPVLIERSGVSIINSIAQAELLTSR